MDETYKKMLDDLLLERRTFKHTTKCNSCHTDISVNFDFASLYPTMQKTYNPFNKNEIRKKKIRIIFDESL